MSTIDERIVSMKFNNSQFENGIKTTLGSLDRLKSGLNLDGAAKSLNGLAEAGGRFSLKNVGDAVDGIALKFTSLQVIGAAALGILTSKALELAHSMASTLTSAIRGGFQEYETNMNSIQTILANTQAAGTTLDDVNGALQELNTYSDKTIYNFSEMAKNIGTFTAAGVDLKTSTQSIKGIANLAALSGSNSQQASTAMYQLSQAISAGKVSLQDWNSVVNAGMGGTTFQRALAQTAVQMGKLDSGALKLSGKMKNVTIDGESFRESIMGAPGKESWLTSDVLTSTLKQFTGDLSDAELAAMGFNKAQIKSIQATAKTAASAAQDVKSFSQLMGTIAETAGSGWTQSWQLVLGDFGQAKKLFTDINNIVGPMQAASAKARNDQLKLWQSLGGRDAAVGALMNTFKAFSSVLNPIKEAWKEVFPPKWGETLANISKALQTFTAHLILSEKAQERVKFVAKAVFTVLKFGFDIIGGIIKVLASGIGLIFRVGTAFIGILGPVLDFFIGLNKGTKESKDQLGGFFDTIIKLREMAIVPLIDVIHNLTGALDDFLNGDPSVAAEKFHTAFSPFIKLGEQLKKNWSAVSSFFKSAWDFIKPIAEAIGGFISKFTSGFKDLMKGVDINTVLAAINTGFLAMIILTIKKYLDTGSGFLESFTGMFEGLTGVLEGMQKDLQAKALIKIAVAIGILAASLLLLTMINPANLGPAVAAMAGMTAALVGAMAVLNKMANNEDFSPLKLNAIALSMIFMAIAVDILASAIVKMGGLSYEELAKGLIGLSVAMGTLVTAALVIDKMKGQINSGARAMVVLSLSVLILAAALKIFATMSWGDMAKAGTALAGVLAIVVGALMLLSVRSKQIEGAAGSILIVSVAIGILVGAISALALIPTELLVKGLTAVGVALGLLVGALLAISINNKATKEAALAMLAMAFAVGMLVTSVVALGAISIQTLIQGLAGIAAILVILIAAMSAMTGALPGAAATVIVAGAVLLLSFAIGTLGSMDVGTLIKGMVALAAVFVILAVAGLALAPLVPTLFLVGAALLVVGVGVLALTAAMVVFSLGLALFGPAAILAAGGISVLAEAIMKVTVAVPAFLLVAAALLLFGVGAAVAAVGVALLGGALIILGAGLALVGATGLIGATILAAAVNVILQLLPQVPAMLALGAAFLVLGAGLVVIGAGAVLVGAGALMAGVGVLAFAAGLSLLSVTAPLAAVALTTILTAMINLIPLAMTALANGIVAFVNVIAKSGPAFVRAMTTVLLSIITAIKNVSFKIIDTLVQLVLKMVNTLVTNVPKLVVAGMRLIIGILTGIANNIGKIVDAATNIVVNFINGIARNLPKIIQSGFNLIISFIEGLAKAIRSNSERMTQAGLDLATAIIDGMANGIRAGVDRVVNAAKDIASGALNAVKNFLGIHSPSREFYKLGQYVNEGFAKGLSSNSVKSVQAAYSNMKKMLGDLIRSTSQDVTDAQKKLEKLTHARKKDTKAIREARQELVQAKNENAKAKAGYTTLTKALSVEERKLESLAKGYENLTVKIGDANKKLEDAKKTRDDYNTSIKNQYSSLNSISKDTTLQQYTTDLQQQINDTLTFASELQDLHKLGLNDTMYKKLLEQGTGALPFVHELLASGKTGVDQLNGLGGALEDAASKLGNTASTQLYQAAVDSAAGLVKGLQDQQKNIEKQMDKIADSMVNSLKKKLGIHSPSREFAKIGGYSTDGLAKGLIQTSRTVDRAAEGVGYSAISSLKKSMSGIASTVSAEMDMSPTIRPVLDLSSIKKDSGLIDGLIKPKSLSLSRSYESASAASSAYKATQEAVAANSEADINETKSVTFIQNNNSPKALSQAEIYRNTKNQLSKVKGDLTSAK